MSEKNPGSKTVTANVEELQTQIRQNRDEITQLKQELEKLRAELGLSDTEELEAQLTEDEILEFGTLNNGAIKGKINWMNTYLISITTSEDEMPGEVLLFKHALAYIRKSEKKLISRRGMYI